MKISLNELSPSDHQKAHDFLLSHPVGVLATTNPDNTPQASAVYFSIDKQLNVYFTTKRDTSKHQNIEHNPTVVLVVYEAQTQTSVQLQGKASLVDDPETMQSIFHGTLDAAEKTGKDVVPPIAKIFAGPYVAYKLTPDSINLSEYGWGDNFAHALKHANEANSGGDPN
jgi:general stress protein 26